MGAGEGKKARNFGPPPSGSHPPLEWRAWAHCLSHRCLCLLVGSSLLFFILFFSFIDEKKLVLCGWAKRLRHQFWPKSATQILAKVGQIFWPQSDWPKVGLAKVFMKDKLCFASKRHAHHACRSKCAVWRLRAFHVSGGRVGTYPSRLRTNCKQTTTQPVPSSTENSRPLHSD